jgi:hypothetical protein
MSRHRAAETPANRAHLLRTVVAMGVALTGGGVSLVSMSCGGTVVAIGDGDAGDARQDIYYSHIDAGPREECYPRIGIYEPDAADAPYNHIAPDLGIDAPNEDIMAPDLGADAPYDIIDSGSPPEGGDAGDDEDYGHIKSP